MSYLGAVEQKSSDIRRINVTSSTSATHTLTWIAPSEQSLIVTINGVKQQNNYTVSGTTLTLDTALVATDAMEVVGILDIGETNIPADNSITTDMIQDDVVTADKLANSINTEIAANTAKVTNATHTGDVTGATALTIANDAVDIPMLSATGTASATTFLRGDNSWTAISEYDDSGLKDDIALLGFKVASNGSLVKYDLVDQTVDDFQDASGVDASASTDEVRNDPGNYYSGSASGPAVDGYVETLLHGDGSDSGTTFTDSSSNGFTVSSSGSIVTSTTNPKFGTASIHIPNATNDYIYWGAGNSNLHLDANDFTFSFWIKTTHSSGTGKIFGRNNGSAGQHNFDIACQIYGSGKMAMVINTDTEYSNAAESTSTVNDGDWHHVEFCRSGSNILSFIDGVGEGLTAVSSSTVINRESSAFYMGYMNGGHYNGAICYIDEFEFSPGIARHTSSFTVPTAPWGESAYNDMPLISNSTTAESTPTKGDLVMTYTNGAGTATLNTDLKAYVSRDNGTTYTQGTLASQGTTGGHTIVTFHDLDISSQPSGTSMRYKIETLNQSVSKETRIHAVSLGWS